MAEMDEEVIDTEVNTEVEDNEEEQNGESDVTFSDEEIKIFSKLGIADPSKASFDDLKALAKRAVKAEERIVSEKKNPKIKTETNNQDLEMRLFFIENPEFKENKEAILETLAKHPSLSPQDALAVYNANKPKESETRKESFNGGMYKPKPKTLAEM